MKTPKIVNAVGHIDEELIESAEMSAKPRKKLGTRWVALAASLAIIVLAGITVIPMLSDDSKHKEIIIQGTELDVEWPWEYKTVYEKYPSVTFNGKKYVSRGSAIGEGMLKDVLGTCKAEGYDTYEQKKHTETFELRSIGGVSVERLVAVGMDGEFYVYIRDGAEKPATFGELTDTYGLTQTLEFNRFTKYDGFDQKGHFTLNDDEYIWEILSGCRDAELFEDSDSFERSHRSYLSFTATSEALGVYKRVFYVTGDGYIWTNIFDYAYVYFIGEEAATKIISYAEQNSTEAEFEPYEYTVSGTLTEIGDGYILIDDSVLQLDGKDGTVFKVLTEDIRIRRYIECTNINVGDAVVVKYRGTVSEGNIISDAYSVCKGTLIEGCLAVAE